MRLREKVKVKVEVKVKAEIKVMPRNRFIGSSGHRLIWRPPETCGRG